MNSISIKNWEKYQHYSKRNPPWIKLYNSLLDDYEYTRLQDASKLLLISLFMLASRCDNEIPADPEWIQQKGMLLGDVDLRPLISAGFIKLNGKDASIPLATCKQDASEVLHQSRDRDREEKDMRISSAAPALLFPLKDGSEYPLELAKISQYEKTYRNINVPQELRNCLQWDIDNPDERKTKKGILKHINFWLNGASKDKGPPIQKGIDPGDKAVMEARENKEEYDPIKAREKIRELALGVTKGVG